MIPVFAAAGYRIIAPDLAGFGRPDKPVEDAQYTFDFRRNMLLQFVDHLDLKNIHLACQDWGGLLGLYFAMSPPFERLLTMDVASLT